MKTIFLTREIIQKWKTNLVKEEKSKNTVIKYISDAEEFMAFTSGRNITKELALEYKRYLISIGYAPRSVNSKIASLNNLFIFLHLEICKLKSLRLQREIYISEEKELTKEEYVRLVDASKKNRRLYLIIQTICGTGIRVSELQYFTVEAVKCGTIMVSCKNKTRNILVPGKLECSTILENMGPYKNALRFADNATAERLIYYNRIIKENIEEQEKIRREYARIEQLEKEKKEKKEKEKKRQNEINTLQETKLNQNKIISQKINEKEQLEKSISERRIEIRKEEKLKKCSIVVLIFFAITFTFISYIVFFSLNWGKLKTNYVVLVLFLISEFLFVGFTVKMLKEEGENICTRLFIIVVSFMPLVNIIICGHAAKRIKDGKEKISLYFQEINDFIDQTKKVDNEINNIKYYIKDIDKKILDIRRAE